MRSTHFRRKQLSLLFLLAVSLAAVTALFADAGSGAARELRSGVSAGAAKNALGVTYGPYLGKRCRHADYSHCDLIGIDVVFGRRAVRVVAEVGGQQISLRTPGKHNGIRYRDWVGNFTHPNLHHHQSVRGTYLIYVPVELHVHFADGHRARALLPRVLVSPGWG
jgi:hypothetical protein